MLSGRAVRIDLQRRLESLDRLIALLLLQEGDAALDIHPPRC